MLAIVGLAATAAPTLAQPARKIKIGLDVQFDNKDIQAEAMSYLSRELRSLGDVELVTSGANLVIHALGAGDDAIAISTVVERVYHEEWFQKVGIEIMLARGKILKHDEEIPAEVWKGVKGFVGQSDILGQWVQLTKRRELKDSCIGLVAQIDTQALSKQRERISQRPRASE
jgi:hypothetical protein